MADKKMLPIGVDIFEKLVRNNFYYVDKTMLIAELLRNWGEVNLFTRPRRFGKSLNMNMLQAFFEIGCDKALFKGLRIAEEKELCEKHMGRYPVISISLKGVEGLDFESAKSIFRNVIGNEAMRFQFLSDSEKLSDKEKNTYNQLVQNAAAGENMYSMSDDIMQESLRTLSMLLSKHYGKNVILLIDEYDVPLDKAFQYGYYNEMVLLLRNVFGNVLKTNSSLQFAVLTGCLRISKESIFTGLNNFAVFSITDVQFAEYFGFTDQEVREMLEYYELSDCYDTVKKWYDGYYFGETGVYCPWDVINYCKKRRADSRALPENYWSNTSGNGIVRRFIDKANMKTRAEIEKLIVGEEIEKEIHQDLTYNELDNSIENLWSVLFTTGYLTQKGQTGENRFRLAIPNLEIQNLFIRQIREWFRDETKADTPRLDAFCNAFPEKDPVRIEKLFEDYLWKTISIRDTAVGKRQKENFYHGILLGLLAHKEDWLTKSNTESGIGYSDILVEIPDNRIGIAIEVKYAENGDMDAACKKALKQIEEKEYIAKLKQDGMREFIKYGIACYKKDCRVELG